MSSAKQIAVFVFAGAVSSVAAAQTAPASVSLVVNKETQIVQTPTLPAATGISYALTGASNSLLRVYTEGFLFCANVSPSQVIASPASFTPAHEDQSFTPAHPWAFSPVTDVLSVGYRLGEIAVNRNASTLTCRGTRKDGSITTNAAEGIFDNAFESTTTTNYNHLINWAPASPYDWTAADWSQVPTNPCMSTGSQPAAVVESAGCAAVTGVRPAEATPNRAATLWTATDGITFTYVFRLDARFGAQPPELIQHFGIPTGASVSDAASGTTYKFIDAYDSAYLGASAQFCYLASLPTTLNSTICSSAATYNITGPLVSPTLTVSPPPVGSGSTSYYVAVIRQVGQGSHPNLTTPVVGVSILVDPALVAEGGDKFIGDDVAFGFIPSSTSPSGFPWMYGQ